MHNSMLSRAEHRLIRGLRRRKIREEEGLFLAEGVRVVEDLLDSTLELRLAAIAPGLAASDRGRALADRLRERCPTRTVEDADLADLAATETPQGVLVVAATPRTALDELRPGEAATLLVLDAVQDPGNLGTLVRTAEALGAIGVAALPGTVDPWNPKAVRAAAGAAFRIPIAQPSVDEFAAWAHRGDITVYGAEAEGEAVDRVELRRRSALVVGNEGAGLTPDARRVIDRYVSVPIRGQAESLNVAVAAGILLYIMTR